MLSYIQKGKGKSQKPERKILWKKFITANFEIMGKFAALAKALEDCGLPAHFSVAEDGFFLSVPLWNCEDGSGEMFEVFALTQEDFRFGHAVSNCGKSFEEVCNDFYEVDF